MPGTLEIGGDTFNIYGSEAEAKVYLAASINSAAWDSAEPEQKKKAQVSATRMFDRELWEGTITVPGQVLAWPRAGATDREGEALADNVIPVDIEEGSYELALSLLNDATVEEATNSGSNVKRVKAGTAEVEFFKPIKGTQFPTKVQDFIKPYLASAGGITTFVSGDDQVSAFPGCYDLNRGYA